MNLSLSKLESMNACEPGIELYKNLGCPDTVERAVALAMERGEFTHCNWLLTRIFTPDQNAKYAARAAEAAAAAAAEAAAWAAEAARAAEAAAAAAAAEAARAARAARAAEAAGVDWSIILGFGLTLLKGDK